MLGENLTMELGDYFKIIKKHYLLILVITILVGVSSFVFTLKRPVVYNTSLSLFITRSTSESTQDYKYDGYYAIKAAELFSDTVKQWLESPEVVLEIYKKAEVDLEIESLKKLAKIFKAYKMSPQYVEVRFKAKEKEKAQKISSVIPSVLQNKVQQLTWNSRDLAFYIRAANPVIVENRPKPLFNGLIGLVSGFVLGIFVVFFGVYLGKD